MKKLALSAVVMSFSLNAFAEAPDMSKMGPWTRPVTKKDEKGIDALYKTAEEACKKGDLTALAELNDYPIHMATDDQAGKYSGSDWSKDKWVAEMKPMFANPPPKDMKTSVSKKVHFLSDTLAAVIEEHSQTLGKVSQKWTSQSTVVLKDGKWLFKTMTEAGWGGAPDTASAKK